MSSGFLFWPPALAIASGAETLPIITITDVAGGGVGGWSTNLFAPGTQIFFSNPLNRAYEIAGGPAVFPDTLREEFGVARYPEGYIGGSRVALCCNQPIQYFYTPPTLPFFDPNPSFTFDAVLRGAEVACVEILPGFSRPCGDFPINVADVHVNIPGRVTLNFVGPDLGYYHLVSGTFTPLPEPATWAFTAAALLVLGVLRSRVNGSRRRLQRAPSPNVVAGASLACFR